MDVSGAGSQSASMLSTIATKTEVDIAVQKKEMEMEKEIAAKLVESMEQSAPKPNATGSVGGNIDVMV
jgi:hypothetical protein